MIYLQHTDPIVCVPQHISRYGLYSAQLILLNTICNLYKIENYNIYLEHYKYNSLYISRTQ